MIGYRFGMFVIYNTVDSLSVMFQLILPLFKNVNQRALDACSVKIISRYMHDETDLPLSIANNTVNQKNITFYFIVLLDKYAPVYRLICVLAPFCDSLLMVWVK